MKQQIDGILSPTDVLLIIFTISDCLNVAIVCNKYRNVESAAKREGKLEIWIQKLIANSTFLVGLFWLLPLRVQIVLWDKNHFWLPECRWCARKVGFNLWVAYLLANLSLPSFNCTLEQIKDGRSVHPKSGKQAESEIETSTHCLAVVNQNLSNAEPWSTFWLALSRSTSYETTVRMN